jgi:hypothetical protein
MIERTTAATRILVSRPLQWVATCTWSQALFAFGTLFAWAHTADEMRIGQVVALPFAVANTAAVFTWGRYGRGKQAALAIAFGLLWIVTVVPYHVIPLLQGVVTWQNVSGLSRVAGGLLMVGTGVALIWRAWRQKHR